MTTPSDPTSAGVSHVPGAPPSSPNRRNSDVGNVEEPSLGLSLSKSVFGISVSLARYIVDDPLWSILAAAGLPCPTCVHGKNEGTCSIVPHLAWCSNCDNKKLCVLGRLARFQYFSRKCSRDLAFAHRFLEVHGDPGQRTRYSLPTEQWRLIYGHVKQSTNSTSALLELNPLDDQDQRELDRQELWEFCQQQPLVPVPLPLVPRTSLLAGDSSLPPCAPPVDRSSSVTPTVPPVKGVSDYCRVVLILRPPHIPGSELPTLPEVGHLVPADSSHRSVVNQSRSQGYTEIPHRVPQAGLFEQFMPPSGVEDFSRNRIKTPPVQQRLREPLHPYPHSQASSALRVDNDRLKTEVEELRALLAQSRGQELEASRRSLEEVARDRAEYQWVLSQFRAIEAELPEPPSEDLVTCFRITHSEVDAYREVAKHQKQELRELRKQVDDATNRSSDAYAELDAANARALRQRDRLEELEELVCQYRNRAHVAEGLIRQYPEDDGGLLEAITLLLYRGLHHTPDHLPSIIDFVLGYLSQARFTHGELHLQSMSSLLYYYSNAADRVEGLYQEMLTHSRFPSHDTFLTAAQHAGCVDACPGSLEPPLHRRFFSFDHPIPISSSPTSNHLPAVPALDSIMVSWERLIANYICDMIDTPGPHYLFPTSTELPDVGGSPSLLAGSVLAEGGGENVLRGIVEVEGGVGIAVRRNATTPTEEGDKDLPEGGSETPLFLPASRSPSSPIPLPSLPIDMTHFYLSL
ncbi:MAG: hypothetical protein NXY57DRAFT_968623 [Lentinula lateritia]|nr:MAG: hypothetical protein NXY57DRAFT_968623 [Lentinula lateritia]